MAGKREITPGSRKDHQARRTQLVHKLRLGMELDRATRELGYSERTRYELRHDAEIRAVILETQAAQFMDLVPLARKALRECLESTNERVKADTSKFVLKESGALAALQQANIEGRQPTTEEIVAATSRLESLLQGAKQAQAKEERTIEHEPEQ